MGFLRDKLSFFVTLYRIKGTGYSRIREGSPDIIEFEDENGQTIRIVSCGDDFNSAIDIANDFENND